MLTNASPHLRPLPCPSKTCRLGSLVAAGLQTFSRLLGDDREGVASGIMVRDAVQRAGRLDGPRRSRHARRASTKLLTAMAT